MYAYAREDLDAWESSLNRELPCGVFGENFTTGGVDVNGAVIGETWAVGTALLQVSCPRIPFVTFAVWLGQERWVPRFTTALMPGAYLRVLRAGEVRAGDAVVVRDVPDHRVNVRTAFLALTTRPDLLPLLRPVSQLPSGTQALVQRRLRNSTS